MKRTLILAAAMAALATSALAETQGKSIDAALANIKIDAAAAAKAAEAFLPGKVASLDVDEDDKTGEPVYAVEIVDAAGKEHKVVVNGLTGAVTQAQADNDHDGEDGDSD